MKILYFGVLKEFFGSEKDVIALADESSVADLLHLLRGGLQTPPAVWSSMAVAVNREYAGRSTVLHEGDEVALLPPVSGGLA